MGLPSFLSPYARAARLEEQFREASSALGATERIVGFSTEGRPLRVFEAGPRDGVPLLLTSLVHGVEVVGALALLDVTRRLASELGARIREQARVVLFPIVNPDAFATNMERLARGASAWQRGNARGVDLNRNFPVIGGGRSWHPFSGSRLRFSPHYAGPSALSEPETRAVHALARGQRPTVSLSFHSFGRLLLYPWAHTPRPNPRASSYEELGRAFRGAQRGEGYRVGSSHSLYPVVGDMDDWLDAELGTMAFTVEVGRPGPEVLEWRRLFNPFCWMNAADADHAVDEAAPGVFALLGAALGAGTRLGRRASWLPRGPLDLASAR